MHISDVLQKEHCDRSQIGSFALPLAVHHSTVCRCQVDPATRKFSFFSVWTLETLHAWPD
jgi:hypothetical protein